MFCRICAVTNPKSFNLLPHYVKPLRELRVILVHHPVFNPKAEWSCGIKNKERLVGVESEGAPQCFPYGPFLVQEVKQRPGIWLAVLCDPPVLVVSSFQNELSEYDARLEANWVEVLFLPLSKNSFPLAVVFLLQSKIDSHIEVVEHIDFHCQCVGFRIQLGNFEDGNVVFVLD